MPMEKFRVELSNLVQISEKLALLKSQLNFDPSTYLV